MIKFDIRHSDFEIPLAGRYVFAEAAGHTDGRVTRQTLPGALEWLWQEYTPNRFDGFISILIQPLGALSTTRVWTGSKVVSWRNEFHKAPTSILELGIARTDQLKHLCTTSNGR